MLAKDFDKLLREKFDSFEAAPSARSWQQISSQLEGKKNKLPVLWLAAAAIAAVIAAALWLNVPTAKPKAAVVAKEHKEGREIAELKVSQARSEKQSRPDLKIVPVSKGTVSRLRRPKQKPMRMIDVPQQTVVSQKSPSPALTVTALEIKEPVETVSKLASEEFYTAVLCGTEQNCGGSEPATSRTRIKSVGDLVNFVVGKVDKRKDKIIEFTKEEEGDVVSGINLGLVHFKNKE